MTVGITGIDHKLGNAISRVFYSSIPINENLDGLFACDVFINNLAKSNLQEVYFEKVFNWWLDYPRTIVNIISTVVFDEVNTLGSYGEAKISFYNKVKETVKQHPNKLVRVINIYPSTLSSNKNFDYLNKVDIHVLARLIKTLVETPQEVEIRDVCVYPTTLNKKFEKVSVL